ncbi:DNA mismatch endonuclease Vsr [Nibribacter ruber]|uniref:DNA mismatch endonuclease Vsr n=1 Tax=Nibribacter ruber TaxID=2698458 RepID=A0A6P1NXR8_9BACT|nr:very short patch repair endonuclease [Nibribacter ruber]QHL87810.1 DNA mismatch endonuclease Vsr [Nibribacter ruber]
MQKPRKKKKKYRLPATPPLTAQERVSKNMRANKSKNTQPEVTLRKALWQAGLRGYRLHWKHAPGKPDICYPGRQLAIYVHGCFWHRCPHCQPALPKSNTTFWEEKFAKNQARDQRHRAQLKAANWQVLVIWECQLQQDLAGCLFAIKALHEGVPDSYSWAA